jgi:hypothetical protein
MSEPGQPHLVCGQFGRGQRDPFINIHIKRTQEVFPEDLFAFLLILRTESSLKYKVLIALLHPSNTLNYGGSISPWTLCPCMPALVHHLVPIVSGSPLCLLSLLHTEPH